MSASLSHPHPAASAWPRPLRFGVPSGAGVQWRLERNCSITPRQMLGWFAPLGVASLGIALVFWLRGATLVMPFASLEVLALGVAALFYARHAVDRECIRLQPGRLTVEHTSAQTTQRAEFVPASVRVEAPRHDAGALVELSGRGQRIAVGRYLRPELRPLLADELRWALRRWQGDAWQDVFEN